MGEISGGVRVGGFGIPDLGRRIRLGGWLEVCWTMRGVCADVLVVDKGLHIMRGSGSSVGEGDLVDWAKGCTFFLVE